MLPCNERAELALTVISTGRDLLPRLYAEQVLNDVWALEGIYEK